MKLEIKFNTSEFYSFYQGNYYYFNCCTKKSHKYIYKGLKLEFSYKTAFYSSRF